MLPFWGPDHKERVKDEIKEWENDPPGFISKVSDVILYPAQKAADLLIPQFAIDAVEVSIQGCLKGLLFTSSYTISKAEILQKLKKENSKLCTIQIIRNSDDLESMDKVAEHYWNWNLSYAISQGLITGATGLPGFAANIPTLFTIIFRMLQQISLSYGYDPDSLEEKHFLLSVLSVASSANLQSKQAAILYLKQVQVQLAKKTWKKLTEEKALIIAIREFAKSLGFQLTKRKALQMVPIIGGAIGASFDGTYCNDVARAAIMAYRKRKIEELNL